MKSFFLILLLGFILIPNVFAYNSGFQPVYQPPVPPGGISNIHTIGNVTSWGCSTGQVLAVTGLAIWGCYTLSGTGEINTASSSGLGQSLVLTKNVFDLPFKGIAVSGDLTISSNATDVTIGHTGGSDTNTAQATSAGGLSLVKTNLNATNISLKGLTAGQGISMTQNTNDIQIDTDFLVDTLSLLANDYFISAFNNSTGDWTTKQFSVNTITCSGTDKLSAVNNVTGQGVCTADVSGSGISSINSAPATTAKILQSNSTTKATFKTLTQGTGITLTNGSNAVTIATTAGAFKNKLLDGSNHTDTIVQTASRGSIIVATDPGGGALWNELVIGASGTYLKSDGTDASWQTVTASGGATSLAANVTGTMPGTDYLVFTIPLTANSGNTVHGVLTATSSVSGTAVRASANVTTLNTHGYCHWTGFATVTTEAVDYTVMNTVLTGRATNTAETLWVAAAYKPQPIDFSCSVVTGATPGNMKLFITPEVAGATISAKAGSFYIKTP